MAAETKEFLRKWGVRHRKLLAYFAQSNGRAEVAVKAAKWALLDREGSLNTDHMVKALLTIRNTPSAGCRKLPAEIILNRKLCGLLPSPFRGTSRFECGEVDPVWREAWELKEQALRVRAIKSMEHLGEHSRPIGSLKTGE